MKVSKRALILVPAIILMGACSLGPDYVRPEIMTTSAFSLVSEDGVAIAETEWFNFFGDPSLKNLVSVALENNRDLAVAAARVEESRALLGFVRANQFPRLDISGVAARSDASAETAVVSSGPFNNFGLFGEISWELDIWGRLRRATEAQRAELLSSEYSYRALLISLISQVAGSYFLLIDLSNQVEIAERTLKNRQNSTALIRTRFKGGVISQLDLNQAEIEESDAAVVLASLRRDRRQVENSLSVLLGRMPAPIKVADSLEGQVTVAKVPPTGFPAQLLERRPDLLAAEERLRSQTAQIGVAQAERLPRIDLLGLIGLQSKDSSDLFQSSAKTWSIAGSLLGPLVDFGKSRANSEAAKARARQALSQYEQTVLSAVQEVEDALIACATFQDEWQARQLQIKAAQNASKLTAARYDEGVAPYLEVLDIERSLFSAELGLSSAKRNYLVAVVQLYKALGGGWSES